MEDLIIVGTGDRSKDVKNFVERYKLFNIVGYACSKEYVESSKKKLPNENVYFLDELDKYFDKSSIKLFVAISHFQYLNRDRRNIFNRLKNDGWHFATLIFPTATLASTSIGEGSWIMDDAYIGVDVIIGENTVVGVKSVIAHYNKIGNHIYIAPNSTILGNVDIGDSCFVGSRSLIFNNVKVGEKCLIGGGTIIKRNLPSYCHIKLPDDVVIIRQFDSESIEMKLIPPQFLK